MGLLVMTDILGSRYMSWLKLHERLTKYVNLAGSPPVSLAKASLSLPERKCRLAVKTLGSKEHCLRLYRKDIKRDCHGSRI